MSKETKNKSQSKGLCIYVMYIYGHKSHRYMYIRTYLIEI